jgi:hypothetical protein
MTGVVIHSIDAVVTKGRLAMTCASFDFKHDLSCNYCSELTISTSGLVVNVQSVISIVMHNGSAFQAWGTPVLYWSQVVPDTSNPGCYLFSNLATATEIAGPDVGNTIEPMLFASRGSATFTFPWVPNITISGSPQCPNLLGLFVQAYAIAQPAHSSPAYCPAGQWNRSDFGVQSVYNAGQVFAFTP